MNIKEKNTLIIFYGDLIQINSIKMKIKSKNVQLSFHWYKNFS